MEKIHANPMSLPTRPLEAPQHVGKAQAILQKATFVYVQRGSPVPPLTTIYQGPYKVKERGPKYFMVEVGGRMEAVTVDHFEPHLGTAPVDPAVPPYRGSPPCGPLLLQHPHQPRSWQP